MTGRVLLIVAAGGLAVGIMLGATFEGRRMAAALATESAAHASQLHQQAQAHAAALAEQRDARLALEDRLQTNDTKHYKELTNARAENARLAADLRAADRRLSIRTTSACPAGSVPAAPGTAGMDHGAGRVDIHPEDAADLVGLAGDADACAVTLTALQAWAREVTRRN